MSDHKEIVVDHLAPLSNHLTSSVPIKKRLCVLAQFSSPPLPPGFSGMPHNKLFLSESESSVPDAAGHLDVGSDIPIRCYRDFRGESIVDMNANMSLKHESPSQFNHHESKLQIINNSSTGNEDVSGLILNDKLEPNPLTENAQLVSSERRQSEQIGEAICEGKFVPSDKPVCPRFTRTLELQCTSKGSIALFRNRQNMQGSSLKQEKEDYFLPDLALDKEYSKSQHKCSVSEQKFESAHVKGANWDLNTATDTCDSSLDGSLMKHKRHDGLELGGMQKKRVESCPVEMSTLEFMRTDVKVGKHMIQERNFNISFSDVSTGRVDYDVGLDLQLKPPCRPEIRFAWGDTDIGSSEEPSSIREMTNLSLSSAGTLKVVKSELCEEGCPMDIKKVELNYTNSMDRKQPDSEQCQGTCPSAEDSSNLKSSTSIKSLEGSSLQVKLDNGSMTSYSQEVPKDTIERMVFDLNSEPVDYDSHMFHDGLEIHINANKVDPGKIAGESEGLSAADSSNLKSSNCRDDEFGPRQLLLKSLDGSSLQVKVDNGSMTSYSQEVPKEISERMVFDLNSEPVYYDSHVFHDGLETHINANKVDEGKIADESEDTVSQALISIANNPQQSGEMPRDSSILQDANGVMDKTSCDLTADLSPGFVISDGNEPMLADGVSRVIIQTGCSGRNDSNLPKFVAEELCVDSYGIFKTIESDGEEIDMSIDTTEQEIYENKNNSCHSHDAVTSARDMVFEERGGDNGYANAEVSNMIELHAVVGDPVEQREEKHVHNKESASTIGPPSVHITKLPLHDYVEDKQIQSSYELKNSFGSIGYGCELYIDKSIPGIEMSPYLDEPCAARMPSVGKNGLIKTTCRSKRNPFLDRTKRNHFMKYKGYEKNSNFRKRHDGRTFPEGSQDGEVGRRQENAIESDMQPIKRSVLSKTDSASIDQAKIYGSGRGKHDHIHKLNSYANRLWARKKNGAPTRLMAPHDERHRLNYRSFRREKPYHAGWRDERFNDRFWKFECESRGKPVGEHSSDLALIRRAENRPESTHEAGFAVVSDDQFGSAGIMARETVMDGKHHLSRFPSNGCGIRDGKLAMGSHTAEDSCRITSPTRCTGKDLSDFILTPREKFKRALSDVTVVPSMQLQRQTQYEHAENTPVQRERRGLPPIHRRGPAHLAGVRMKSAKRSPTHSSHQWLSTRRSLETFDGHPEEQCRSAHQHPCFAGDDIIRRHGSPPIPTFPGRDNCPSRDHEFLRPVMDLQRNTRAAEECLGTVNGKYFSDRAFGAEYADDRCGERHGALRSFRQCPIDGGNEGILPYHDEDAPPVRDFPEVEEEFPGRHPRNHDGHIKNRPRNNPGLQGMEEQEENFRYRCGKECHNVNFNQGRWKRRRYNNAEV